MLHNVIMYAVSICCFLMHWSKVLIIMYVRMYVCILRFGWPLYVLMLQTCTVCVLIFTELQFYHFENIFIKFWIYHFLSKSVKTNFTTRCYINTVTEICSFVKMEIYIAIWFSIYKIYIMQYNYHTYPSS